MTTNLKLLDKINPEDQEKNLSKHYPNMHANKKTEVKRVSGSVRPYLDAKPCPFCGSTDIRIGGAKKFHVFCGSCWATGGFVWTDGKTTNRISAIKKCKEMWDMRVGE